MPLIDIWMPEFDVAATYSTEIAAGASTVYQSLLDLDPGRIPLISVLMGLRMLPAAVVSPSATRQRLRAQRARGGSTLRAMLNREFVLLQEEPPRELVIGVTGRFWTLAGGLMETDPARFRDPPPAGSARAAWNFLLIPAGDRTLLSTETRVRCADPATRRTFRRYWRLVAPGSGLIRWAILRQVRRAAESSAR